MNGIQERHARLVSVFLRWSLLQSALGRGYWLVASLYLVIDARLSPAQLVFIGVAQGIASLLFEVPTGVVADTVSRKASLVISCVLVGLSMIATGLATAYPALVVTQMLWGVAWTFTSGADVAWITDELGAPALAVAALTSQARSKLIGAVGGMLSLGGVAWAIGRGPTLVIAGAAMMLLGLYVQARFSERNFTPTRSQHVRQAWLILTRGLTLARRDVEILMIFAATFLINGASDGFGRLETRQLVALGFPDRPDPIVWFTALGVTAYALGALAFRIVEARIHGAGAARRMYVAACAIGVAGVWLFGLAPSAVVGSAGVLLVTGVAWTVTRAVGAIWVNERVTNEVRATVQSFLAQVEYFGEICCGAMLAALAGATSLSATFVAAGLLVAAAGLVAARAGVMPRMTQGDSNSHG